VNNCPSFLYPRKLNLAIQSSLIVRERVPPQCTCARVENGTLSLMDADNFVLRLTLEHPSPFARWRLVDFQLQLPFKVTISEGMVFGSQILRVDGFMVYREVTGAAAMLLRY